MKMPTYRICTKATRTFPSDATGGQGAANPFATRPPVGHSCTPKSAKSDSHTSWRRSEKRTEPRQRGPSTLAMSSGMIFATALGVTFEAICILCIDRTRSVTAHKRSDTSIRARSGNLMLFLSSVRQFFTKTSHRFRLFSGQLC